MRRSLGAAVAVIVLVVVGLMSPSWAAPPTPTADTGASDDPSVVAQGYSCQGAQVVGIAVRGTADAPGPGHIAGPVIKKVMGASKQKVAELDLVYPASKGGEWQNTYIQNYRHSEQRGVANLRNLLDRLPEICGTTPKVFLVGMSQGAEVIADALAWRPVPLDNQIKAVVLNGNLTFNGSEAYDMPKGPAGYKPGEDGQFGRVKDGLAPFADRLQDWCGKDDGFCQKYLPNRSHETDYGVWAEQQAEFILGKIGG